MKPIDRQFRQLAFTQVLLGMLAFCIAEGQPVLLAFVGLLALVSWFVTEGPRRAGLDRNLLNLGAMGAVLLMTAEALITHGANPVVMVGHFTMALQMVLLFAKKTRREYAQLAVLSPLQVIAGSVLPGGVTLVYGLLLVLYCFLTLLTVLVFQLKSAGDLVHQRHRDARPEADPPDRPEQVAGPRHRLHFRASAVVIALCCGVVASFVFVVIPRSQQDPFAAALVGGDTTRAGSQTGFNARIHLGTGSIAGGSSEPVLNLTMSQDGTPIGSEDQAWLIRGAVQDTYDPLNKTWSRPPMTGIDDHALRMTESGVRLGRQGNNGTREAAITLRRRSVTNLFTVVSDGGPVAPTFVDAPGLTSIHFSGEDQHLESDDALASVLRYRVHWHYSPFTDLRPQYRQRLRDLDHDGPDRDRRRRPWEDVDGPRQPPPPSTHVWPVEPERIQRMAQNLLRARDMPADYTDATPQARMDAARALSEYLRRSYRYTLNNPDTGGTDPVIAFLLQTRAGHCELFASGLAALCRSVGIPARLATGYRASEYNGIGGYYVVREAHAHAWTEVDLGPGAGWHVFDATPPAEVEQAFTARGGLLGRFRALYDHLEFNWIATVITYDQTTQQQILGAFGNALSQGPDQWFAGVGDWVTSQSEQVALDTVGRAFALVILAALAVAVVSLVRLLVLRHRRMVALQLTALPRTQRRTLARQLRFYIIMLESLERHGRSRPHWQSPFQFARALADEQPLRFEPVIPLTEMFYEVRFGYRELDGDRLARVRLHLKRLEQNLSASARL
ncbi:MAG: DUF3488 and DUF4129 domain-containing transglutaminase family protein [Phycisphaeraceae bacterium]